VIESLVVGASEPNEVTALLVTESEGDWEIGVLTVVSLVVDPVDAAAVFDTEPVSMSDWMRV
jgi:hypothetical protein